MVQRDRPQMAIWYSGTGHRWQYGTAGQATDGNMVQRDRPQMAIWYSGTGHRWQYGTAGQATDGNMVQRDKPQMTIWRMCFACWITKATDTHSEYLIFIALPRHHWLRERASLLHYTYIACIFWKRKQWASRGGGRFLFCATII